MSQVGLSDKQLDEIHDALLANGLNHSVAAFLTDLAGRVSKLEDAARAAQREG